MKTYFLKNLNLIKSLALILVASLFLASCSDDNDDVVVIPQPETTTSDEIITIPFFVETMDGNLPVYRTMCKMFIVAKRH